MGVQVFVQSPAGSAVVELAPTTTVSQATALFAEKCGVVSDELYLSHAGYVLSAESTIAEQGIQKDSTLLLNFRARGGVIEPSLVVLAKKYNCEKKVCRLCYARLPPRAVNCRKKICGHTNQLRVKKKLKHVTAIERAPSPPSASAIARP